MKKLIGGLMAALLMIAPVEAQTVFPSTTSTAKITGGTINGATVGATTASTVRATSVTTTTGSVVIGTSGQGINFSANSTANPTSGTATSSIQRGYEDGTCTFTDTSGASLAITTTVCNYTKVGRLVFVMYSLTFPTTADSTNASLGGLPFTVLAAAADGTNGTGIAFTTYTTGPLQAYLNQGAKTFNIRTNGQTSLTNVLLSAKVIRGSISYMCSSC